MAGQENFKTIRAVVRGRVQGVWFRGWTTDQARARGLSGWVRNRRDGAVEALFSGPADQVETMIEALHAGPPMARVASVETHPAEPPEGPESQGFNPLPTG